MSNTSPFLTRSVGAACPADFSIAIFPDATDAPAIAPSGVAPPPTAIPQAAATPTFTNSRRAIRAINPLFSASSVTSADLCVMFSLSVLSLPLTQLIQIQLRIPLLPRLHLLLPSHFLPRIRRRPRHHARNRRLHALLRLVMKLPRSNTLHKQFLFLRIRKLQVRSKFPGRRKPLRILLRH